MDELGSGPTIPTFMILGAARCGSTSLYHALRRHPAVYMSEPKEPQFFEAEYERGVGYYRAHYYPRWAGEPVVGEARVTKLFLPFVAPRVAESFPDIKLIALVRHPVERAYSHWWKNVSQGSVTEDFQSACQRNFERLQEGGEFEGEAGGRAWKSVLQRTAATGRLSVITYIEQGYYARHLKRYMELLPASNLLVIFFEDLVGSPEETWMEVQRFIGARPLDQSSIEHRNRPLRPFWSVIGRTIGKRRVEALADRFRFIQESARSPRPTMPRSVREQLLEHYFSHNQALERLVKRNLSEWNE